LLLRDARWRLAAKSSRQRETLSAARLERASGEVCCDEDRNYYLDDLGRNVLMGGSLCLEAASIGDGRGSGPVLEGIGIGASCSESRQSENVFSAGMARVTVVCELVEADPSRGVGRRSVEGEENNLWDDAWRTSS
jgi:hypothetical protein